MPLFSWGYPGLHVLGRLKVGGVEHDFVRDQLVPVIVLSLHLNREPGTREVIDRCFLRNTPSGSSTSVSGTVTFPEP
jgi:hypothetical protein